VRRRAAGPVPRGRRRWPRGGQGDPNPNPNTNPNPNPNPNPNQGGECFSWLYGDVAATAAAPKHAYSYLQAGQLLDYTPQPHPHPMTRRASCSTTPQPQTQTQTQTHLHQAGQLLDYTPEDGSYRVWRLAKPPRAGCPAVRWPAEATGTLAVRRHELAVLPPPHADAISLMDYDPARGDYRLGQCNRTETSLAAHLACRTTANGTWHAGGLQLVWVGQSTLMRYSKANPNPNPNA
jgi:hypothetical protein